MAYSEEMWKHEEDYLKGTLKMIQEQIVNSGDKAENYKDNIISAQKSMWEERIQETDPTKSIEGAAMAWQYQSYMMMEADSMKFFTQLKIKLQRMHESAYFGRIDFQEMGEEEENIYIGIAKLTNDNFMNIRVYDWRAPICSMFYNYETGPVSYECPAGTIEGHMNLKRQYKIEKGHIRYMFDSAVKINDEILQEILGKTTDDKMKTIVTTIQKEQNDLIRDEDHDVLMIQGSAGSGKTSIALHRIAYMLYRDRENTSAKNMVIFSPNQIFNDYISDVLPELGEENVNLTTFNDYLNKMIDDNYFVEDWNGQMEYILSVTNVRQALRKQSIEYKTSQAFVWGLKKYVDYIKVNGFAFEDLTFEDEVIVSAKQMKTMYIDNQVMLSPKKSLNRINIKLNTMLEPYIRNKKKELTQRMEVDEDTVFQEEREENISRRLNESFSAIRRKIDELTTFSIYNIYRKLFTDVQLQKKINGGMPMMDEEIGFFTSERVKRKHLNYEDALGIAYLKGALEGTPPISDIRYVVIDEAQDYSFLHYEIFNQLFRNAKFTLLGDLNQSINPYLNIGKYEIVKEIMSKETVMKVNLKRSYRSSKPISTFCSNILKGKDETIYVDRGGNEPKVVSVEDEEAVIAYLSKQIRDYLSNNHQSIAIICRTEKEGKRFHGILNETLPCQIVTRKDIEYKQGVMVIPSYLAKGLEFDVVMICCQGRNNYLQEEERNLFYTVCSRALHELEVIYTDNKPIFLT